MTECEGLDDVVEKFVERAQQQAPDVVLSEVEALLTAEGRALADGPAGLHFARMVALSGLGEVRKAVVACGLMLAAADREGSPGWRSIALSMRASERYRLVEAGDPAHDMVDVLRDLAAAEVELDVSPAHVLLATNAHIGLAIGYTDLRLYELAEAHYAAAYQVSVAERDPQGEALGLYNLAEFHLRWALELDRVHLHEAAAQHRARATRHGDEGARIDGAVWQEGARLLAACARCCDDEADQAVAAIQRLADEDDARPTPLVDTEVTRLHLGRALARAGRHEEALAVLEKALSDDDRHVDWQTRAALQHAHTVILAETGAAGASAALTYADNLAMALWRTRQRILVSTRTLQDYERMRRDHQLATQEAETDPLTGLVNRRGFDRRVAELSHADSDTVVAVIIVDGDRLKLVNDTLGHAAGDEALRRVADSLLSHVRDGDLVARLGGDEFGVLLPGVDADGAAQIAARMVSAVRALPGPTTVSVGVAHGRSPDLAELLVAADTAMYAAKKAGGDGCRDAA